MPTAITVVDISTIVREQATTESIVEQLRHDTKLARQRADAIQSLDRLGWTLLRQPEGVNSDIDFFDVMAYWRKDFDSADDAERELALAGAFEDLNFSLGWRYSGTDDECGMPDCEWWMEGPGRESIACLFAQPQPSGDPSA